MNNELNAAVVQSPRVEGLSQFIKNNPLGRQQLLERIKEKFQSTTHYTDTHPCLKERVEAINAAPQLPCLPNPNTAEAWLGDKYHEILTEFDENWLQNNKAAWSNRFE